MLGAWHPTTLHCTRDDRTLHVEVKGTTSNGMKALLTRNEVRHTHGTEADVALYVLSGVSVSTDRDGGNPTATGGLERILVLGMIDDHALEPIGYEYTLPESVSKGVARCMTPRFAPFSHTSLRKAGTFFGAQRGRRSGNATSLRLRSFNAIAR